MREAVAVEVRQIQQSNAAEFDAQSLPAQNVDCGLLWTLSLASQFLAVLPLVFVHVEFTQYAGGGLATFITIGDRLRGVHLLLVIRESVRWGDWIL